MMQRWLTICVPGWSNSHAVIQSIQMYGQPSLQACTIYALNLIKPMATNVLALYCKNQKLVTGCFIWQHLPSSTRLLFRKLVKTAWQHQRMVGRVLSLRNHTAETCRLLWPWTKKYIAVFDELQVYRIDHYLGKETVQNILVFRFANGIFEPLWNQRSVDHVQITVAETVGVGSRAGYYDNSGVIRDMFQNHLLQLLALTTMEAPLAFMANDVRDEKVKILRSLRPIRNEDALDNSIRAQYVAGNVDNKRVPGYKDEPGVDPNSITETYLAVRLFIDNWRWAGVPFYLRSGKRLPRRVSEISIHFKQVPLPLFGWKNIAGEAPNILSLAIQPDEGITLTFGAKAPGLINKIEPVKMNFDYVSTFGTEPPDAYERLLLDCLIGDATLFTRTDEVHHAWAFTEEILNGWSTSPVTHLPVYEAGTWGPAAALKFVNRAEGHNWDTH